MKKKSIIIIGGSGLIGSKIIDHLLNKKDNSLNIINLDIKRGRVAKEHYRFCNISKLQDIKNTLTFIDKNFGKIYSIINCSFPKTKVKNSFPLKVNTSVFVSNYSKHLASYLNVIIASVNYFLRKKIKGNLISFASIYGASIPKFDIYENKILTSLEYNFIKNNIIQATQYYAKYIRGSGIKINSISPGGVYDNHSKNFVKKYSNYTNHNSMLSASDVVSLVEFLSLGKHKITGQNIIFDDGFIL